MILAKHQADRILRRIYKALREGEVHVIMRKINTKHLGYYYPLICDIEIDPYQAPIQTAIHEMLHHLYPDDDEDTIEGLESAMCHHMSDRQARNLWVAIADALRANGEHDHG